jgi:hypothetical protein
VAARGLPGIDHNECVKSGPTTLSGPSTSFTEREKSMESRLRGAAFVLRVAALGLVMIAGGRARADLVIFQDQAMFLNSAAQNGATLFTETFESAAPNSTQVGNIQLSGDAIIQQDGSRFGEGQEVDSNGGSFTLTFAHPINQLGFNIFDLGTLTSNDPPFSPIPQTLSVTLSNGDAGTLVSNFTGDQGNELFFGLSDSSMFTSITFTNAPSGTDIIGLDNASYGANTAVSTPEPSTVVLVISALPAGLVWMWKRRRRAVIVA